jgi:hypothetical protein
MYDISFQTDLLRSMVVKVKIVVLALAMKAHGVVEV